MRHEYRDCRTPVKWIRYCVIIKDMRSKAMSYTRAMEIQKHFSRRCNEHFPVIDYADCQQKPIYDTLDLMEFGLIG